MLKVKKLGQVGRVILFFGIVIIFFSAVYFTFFFSYSCDDLACYKAHQRECSRTKFVNNNEGTIWKYQIIGEANKTCEIDVEVLQIKEGSTDKKRIEGKTMICYLPLGDDTSPELDITNCHGLLKEELQKMIIEKLHLYIIENIGEISEELRN
ncbi:MAG: hypothetical protein OQK82_09280 [Candidatus Pacearchaeota archaeon]|nr:hypothetical protein [Candidatus Pacearchaeota archaeon]